MNIYLASPFFEPKELELVRQTEKILEERGFHVFSPQQHEYRGAEIGSRVWAEEIFKMDRDAIRACDVLLAVYHGGYGDTGTAWECGYACAIGKPVVVVHVGEDANLMITESAAANINWEELPEYDFENLPDRRYGGQIF